VQNPTNAVPAVFQFESHDVRTVVIEDEPWFVAKDVCLILGINKSRDAIARLDEDERRPVRMDTLGGQQQMTALSESGLYSLILRSDKKEAKRFRKWVTSEVLPSLRKTGRYEVATSPPSPFPIPQTLPEALRLAADLAEQNAILAPKAQIADRIAVSEGYVTLTVAAKILKVRPREFSRWLQAHRWLYKRPGQTNLIPYQEKIQAGYLDVKYVLIPTVEEPDRSVAQAIFLPAGVNKLAAIFQKEEKGVAA
jgi:anti-repressor protein